MAGTNPRALLLLTDGLQNTAPMIEAVAPSLAGITVHAIGFGTESSLDGALLSALGMPRANRQLAGYTLHDTADRYMTIARKFVQPLQVSA